MNHKQSQAAQQAMSEWLSHPDELGEAPSKIELVGEFDLHGLHYYIFKYKKSRLESWLLGVCGGYEDDSLEHCGHVFSEMENYNEATAKEDAVQMVEMIREYWINEAAKHEENKNENESGGSFVATIPLYEISWDKKQFIEDLQKEWQLADQSSDRGSDNDEIYIAEFDGMFATVSLMPAPIPDGEAEYFAASNYLWPEAVQEVSKQKAHLLVAVLPRQADNLEAGKLFAKICSTCMKSTNAIGVYTAGTVFQPQFYRESAEVMKNGELPLLNWIYFGLIAHEDGTTSGYTYGLESFSKKELEVLNADLSPQDLRFFLFDIAAYILSANVTLQDGETIGFSEEQKLQITLSKGVYLNSEQDTLKIAYQ